MRSKLLWLPLVMLFALSGFVFANGSKEASAPSTHSIVVWMPGNNASERQAFLGLLAAYGKSNPNVRTQFQMIPWSNYFTKLNAAFAGGAAPDVYGLGYGQTGPVQTNGQLLALNSYLKGWSGWTDISKNILDAGIVNKTLYAVMMPDIKVLWYRTDLFKKAGLDPSHGPKTIAQLKEYAKKLTERSSNGELKMAGFNVFTSSGEQSLAETMLMYGDMGLWNAKLQPLWDSPTGLKALNLLNGFVQAKESPYAAQNNVAGSPFQNGLAAMSIESFGSRVVFDKTLGAKNIAFDVQPGGRAQSGATFIGVYSNTKEKTAAVNLLKYFTSDQGQKAIFKGVGFIPTRESLKSWFLSLDPSYAKAWTAMEHAHTYGVMNPHFFEMLKVLRPALESVYYNKSTPEAALKKSAAEYSAKLK